jgi:hypothetical protein
MTQDSKPANTRLVPRDWEQAWQKFGPSSSDPFFTEDRDGVVTFLRPPRDEEERQYQQQTYKALEPHKLVPPELLALPRWVHYHLVWNESKKKYDKPPFSAKTGEGIGAAENDYSHHVTFAEAEVATYKFHTVKPDGSLFVKKSDGNGFVFRKEDGFVGIDIDNCVDKHGVIHAEVVNWLTNFFSTSYQEFSPSGKGIHAIVRGKIPKALSGKLLPGTDDVTVEMYCTNRYFTFTGMKLSGVPLAIADCQIGIDKLWKEVGGDAGPGEGDAPHPMSKLTARKLHDDNLESLRHALLGEGNALLNQTAFFAARAFAAGAIEGTEASIKQQLLDIVTKEWTDPHPEHGAKLTISSGWDSGKDRPLLIAEDEYPQVAETIEEFNNKKHFFIVKNYGGTARVCWEEKNDVIKGESYTLVAQKVHDFKIGYMNLHIQIGVKPNGEPRIDDKASVWLRHPHRKEYDKVVFEPNVETPINIRNLWKGFAYPERKGDCTLYLTHLRDNVCSHDAEKYSYLIRWMAYAVRHPNEQGQVAIVIQGDEGVGKNVAAEKYGALWGGHSIVIADTKGVTSNFNAHLRDKCVLIADEAFFAGDPRQANVLKGLVTGETISIEPKGVDRITVPNLLHIFILGNDQHIISAAPGARRFFVTKCGKEHKQDTVYFAAINDQMRTGGYGALLYHLLHEVDLTGFDMRRSLKTSELSDQVEHSLRGVEAAWLERLQLGTIPGHVIKTGTAEFTFEELLDFMRRRKREWERLTPKQLQDFFGKKGWNFSKARGLAQNKNSRCWEAPSLKVCRDLWKQKYGFPDEWDNYESGEWESVETGDVKF